mgnify:CR=1 FL=1
MFSIIKFRILERQKNLVIYLLTFLLLGAGRLHATDVDAAVEKALKLFNVPGAAVGIVVDDEIIYAKGFGTRKAGLKLPVSEHTLFPIASCTKAFTALILAQLVEENKLAFDDPVIKHIPEFCLLDPDVSSSLTIRDLLAHRTGIARHDPIWIVKQEEKLDILKVLSHLESDCGLRQEYRYNNFMYAVAGMVIERVTKQSWEEAIASRILIPLEMMESNLCLEDLYRTENFSYPHAEIAGKVVEIPFRELRAINPAGGINCSILDLAKWVLAQLSDGANLISKSTLQEMHTTHMPLSTIPMPFYHEGCGLGWFTGKYYGYEWICHSGDIDGFASEVSFLPEEKIGIVILSNSGSDGRYLINAVRNYIYDNLLPLPNEDPFNQTQMVRAFVKQDVERAMSELKNYQDEIELTDYMGIYKHPAYGTVKVHQENEQLYFSYGNYLIPLFARSPDVFAGQFDDLLYFGINPVVDFLFLKDESGKTCKLQIPFEGFRGSRPISFIKDNASNNF